MSAKSFFIKLDAIRQMYWRGLSMRMSLDSANGAHLAVIDDPKRIAELIEFGGNYRPDPLKGKFDATIHPRFVQHKIDTKTYGKTNLDCDDFSMYSCALLLKNKLADKVWFTTIQWGGDYGGHAFYVYQKGEDFFWGDYGYPVPISDKWAYVEKVTAIYSKIPAKHTIMFDVIYDEENESVKIRSPEVKVF